MACLPLSESLRCRTKAGHGDASSRPLMGHGHSLPGILKGFPFGRVWTRRGAKNKATQKATPRTNRRRTCATGRPSGSVGATLRAGLSWAGKCVFQFSAHGDNPCSGVRWLEKRQWTLLEGCRLYFHICPKNTRCCARMRVTL